MPSSGVSLQDLVAVGLDGAIWRRVHDQWQREDSPTTYCLNAVLMLRPDCMFAGGQAGTLLRATGQGWQTVPTDLPHADLWDLAWFDDALYIASSGGLLRCVGDTITIVSGDGAPMGRLHWVHAHDGVLVACGVQGLWWTRDGRTWQLLAL